MLKIRWSHDRLIFSMGILYLGKTVFILRWALIRRSHCISSHGFELFFQEYCVLSTLKVYVVINFNSSLVFFNRKSYIEGLVQERRNSIANALELRLSWTKPSIWWTPTWFVNENKISTKSSIIIFEIGFIVSCVSLHSVMHVWHNVQIVVLDMDE